MFLWEAGTKRNIGGRPVKLAAVYLSPLRSLVDADLLECIGGGTPVLLAGDLNAKHKDWNSRLNSPRGVLERVCVHEFLHRLWTRFLYHYS